MCVCLGNAKRDLLIDCYAKFKGNSCNASPHIVIARKSARTNKAIHTPFTVIAMLYKKPKQSKKRRIYKNATGLYKIHENGFASVNELRTQRTPRLDFVKSRNEDSLTPSLRGQQLAKVICLLSSLRGFAKAEAIHKENPLIETTKSQGDFVESAKDSSDFVDCHEVKASFNDSNGTIPRESIHSCNDEIGANHHAKSQIRNDASITPSLLGSPQGLTKQSINATRTESAESIKDSNIIDLQVWVSYGRNARHEVKASFNDGEGVDCHEFHKLDSRNDRIMTISSKNAESFNDENSTDSHELQSDSSSYKIIAILRKISQRFTQQERFITQTTALSLLR